MDDKRRITLTRETVVEAALRLLDEVGLEGLTVRRLAAELGVQSPALYWHFKGKQELLDGMAEAIQPASSMGPPRKGENWQQWILRRARQRRKALLAHRDGARLITITRPSPAVVQAFDGELEAMVALGFTPLLAVRTILTVGHYITGFVLEEQSSIRASHGPSPAEHSPTLMKAVAEGGPVFNERAFEHGLRVIIDGTAAPARSDELT